MITDNVYGTCKVALITLEISDMAAAEYTDVLGKGDRRLRCDMRDELERDHLYDWVVFHDEQLIGAYEDFQDAAAEAVRKIRSGAVPHQTGWCRTVDAADSICEVEAGLVPAADIGLNEAPHMRYWVYENDPTNKAMVHEDSCGFCNYGEGVRGA